MQKIWKLLLVCLVAVSTMSLNSCKDDKELSEDALIGRWQAVKLVADGVDYTSPEILEFIYIEFKSNGTCIINIDDDDDDDDDADDKDIINFSYENDKLTLVNPNYSGEPVSCKVLELTNNKLALEFPFSYIGDEKTFVIHYKKVK